MTTETKIKNIDEIQINISLTTNIAEWRVIRSALWTHVKGAYYGAPQRLYEKIDECIRTIENQIVKENFEIKP